MEQADMHGRVCLVTGGTSGIGKATAMALAKMGATVVIVGRNPSKGRAVLAEIKKASGNPSVNLLLADLSSQQAIRQLAKDFQEKYQQLHVLLNCAGITVNKRQVTTDGLERTFAVNHLAYFLLTNLLLDILKTSAPSRIVNVSSAAQSFGHINFEDLQGEKNYNVMRAYGQSKLANALFTYELAKRLSGSGVTVNCLHPGFVASNFASDAGGWFSFGFKIAKLFAISPEKGAATAIYLASSPEVEGISGKYFIKCKEAKSSPESYNEAIRQRLWEVSAELTGQSTSSYSK
jgi:retinol dehydrogenase 14